MIDQISNLYKGNSLYKNNSADKIVIGPDDFALLSKFEKNTLRTIANIWGILSSTNKEVDYTDLLTIMNKLGEHKTDVEKHYLLALFFPEKVRNIHTLYPFPIPTYSYTQKFQVFVVPNANGCFLAQVVCVSFSLTLAPAARQRRRKLHRQQPLRQQQRRARRPDARLRGQLHAHHQHADHAERL